MDDFSVAKQYFPNDELLSSIDDVLHLAQVGLLYDPNQIVPQFIGRLPRNKVDVLSEALYLTGRLH